MIQKFDVSNCDIRTQLMWEDWATIPCFKILTLFLARKGKHIFSAKGIGEILDIPKSTVIFTLKLLKDKGYVIYRDNNYYLNVNFGIDQPIGQPTNPLVDIDQPIGRESTNPLVANNNKEIIIKNDIPPSHLKAKKEPLEKKSQYVWLTRKEQEKLLDRFEYPEELIYLIKDLDFYAEKKPKKFKEYKDHYLAMLNFRRMKHSDGYTFFKHPQNGFNYYKNYEIERIKKLKGQS